MSSTLNENTCINGMPIIGLGTFRAEDKETLLNAIKHAIKIGYRHLDCAWFYGNEDVVGQAIKESIAESNGSLKREDLFIVSKLWNTFHAKHLVRKALNETLADLDLDYIDLYLIHWPMGYKENMGRTGHTAATDANGVSLYSDVHYLETYKALEEMYKEGKIKNIGVSNFNISQLQDVLKNCEIKPINNQIEVNPYLANEKLVEFCQKNSICVSAFGPIGGQLTNSEKSPKQLQVPNILEHEVLTKIAKRHSKSTAQVCLRWLIQRNIVVLPKSVRLGRIEENFQIFDFSLDNEEMKMISSLNQNLRIYDVEITKAHKFHPFHQD